MLTDNRPGDADGGCLDDQRFAGIAAERLENRREAVEFLRRIGARDQRPRPSFPALEQTEQRLGASKIAGEQHASGPTQQRELIITTSREPRECTSRHIRG